MSVEFDDLRETPDDRLTPGEDEPNPEEGDDRCEHNRLGGFEGQEGERKWEHHEGRRDDRCHRIGGIRRTEP